MAATTFPQLVRAAAAAYGAAIAIRLDDEALGFVELDRRSALLARGLVARGVGKGMRIGLVHGNGPDFAVTLAAICRVGAVAIPLSTLIRADELVRVLRQSDVGGLVVQRAVSGHDLVERLCEASPALRDGNGPDLRLAEAPYLRWIASTGDALPPAVHDLSWLTGAAGTVSIELLAAIEAEVHPTDQMIEIYTSGSMALPKGVKHDHGPVLFRAQYIAGRLGLARGGEATAFMPMFWVGGLMMSLLANWVAGVTTVCGAAMLANSRIAMGSVLAEEDLATMGRPATIWALGMSETLGPYSFGDVVRVPGYPLSAPLDHIADGYEVRVVADGRTVGQGGTGEIQVRGYPLTSGLHKMARADHFEPDGFYRTGDLGLVDGDRIHFVGRDGDIIKTASANVSPAEVELEMQRLPGIHSAYVVGLPDQERGQLVAAAVVPREGVIPDFDAVEAELRRRLSSYKVPRAYVAITREEVPMLPSNKVARRRIAKLIAERLGRG